MYTYYQEVIQTVFEIGSQFWAHKNWPPNFDELTKKGNFNLTKQSQYIWVLLQEKHFILSFVHEQSFDSLFPYFRFFLKHFGFFSSSVLVHFFKNNV